MSDEHYGKLLHSFWTDPRIKRKLSRDGKLLLAYYFSSPHKNMSGVYYCPILYAADETGIDPETVRNLLPALQDFVTFDPDTDEVFVHGLAETAWGELKPGDNRRKNLESHLKAVHSTRLLHLFRQRYASWGLTVTIPEQRQTPLEGASEGAYQAKEEKNQEEPRRTKTSLVELHSTGPSLAVVDGKAGRARSLEMVQSRLAAVLAGVLDDGSRKMRADELQKVKAELVFAYWAAKLNHTKALLDHDRERRLIKRLEENQGNVHELLYVVDGALKDDWTMGRSPRSNTRYDGIETIYQDRAHVEKFAQLCPAYKAGTPHPMAVKYLQVATEVA